MTEHNQNETTINLQEIDVEEDAQVLSFTDTPLDTQERVGTCE